MSSKTCEVDNKWVSLIGNVYYRMNLFKIIVFLSFIFSFPIGDAANIDKIGNEILEEIWRFHPTVATYQGIHKYDTLLADYSPKSLKKMLGRFKQLEQELDKIDTLTFSMDELVDYHLLRINLISEIFVIEIMKSCDKDPLIYADECINGLYAIMLRSAPSTRVKVNALKGRLKQIPAFLKNASQNLKHPSQFLCEIGIGELNESENLIEEIFTTFQDSLSENEKKDFLLAKNSAIAAIKWFVYWLEKNGDPNTNYVMGKNNYEYMLKYIHLIDINADSLLKLGENFLASTNRMIDSLKKIYQVPPPKKIILPLDFGKDDVVNYQKQEIKFLRDFVAKSNLVTVPDWVGALEIVETPGFMRGILPGMAMNPPGPFDDSNTSYFYLPPIPDKFNLNQAEYFYNYVQNRSFRGGVVHEGYPGHHLQLSISNYHPSIIRKSFGDYFLIEGWALYCEEIMINSGLYEDTLGARINALRNISFRAARVIVDVMLQTGKYDYQNAVNFMYEALKGDSSVYAKEVKRYITDPGQPSSYLLGKLQILELRDEYKKIRGDNFNLKAFHDKLLSQGSIPITLIRKIILSRGN